MRQAKLVSAPIYVDVKVLRYKYSGGTRTKLQTVAASNKSRAACTLLLLVRATCIRVLFFAHIPLVVNCAFNAVPTDRLQHKHLATLSLMRCLLLLDWPLLALTKMH